MTQNLKRCSGTKYPGDKTRILTEPHYTERSNFNKNKNTKDGLMPICRECQGAYAKLWNAENPDYHTKRREENPDYMANWRSENTEHIREYNANYRTKNPEIVKESNAKWRAENVEHIREYLTNWRAKNPDYQINWRAENLDKLRSNEQRRRALKAEAFDEEVKPEILLELHGSVCYLCGQDVLTLPDKWHMEHAIPLSRGGRHSYPNIRVSCADCNLRKNAKTLHEYLGNDPERYDNVDPEAFNRTMHWHAHNTPEIFQ